MASKLLRGATTTVGVGALVVALGGLVVGLLGITTLAELADRAKGPEVVTVWRIEFARAAALTLLSVGLLMGGVGLAARRSWGYWLVVLSGAGVTLLYAFYLFVYFTYMKALIEGMGVGPKGARAPEPSSAQTFGLLGVALLFLVGGGGVALFAVLFVGKDPGAGREVARRRRPAPPAVPKSVPAARPADPGRRPPGR
jgi:hypothetical protein